MTMNKEEIRCFKIQVIIYQYLTFKDHHNKCVESPDKKKKKSPREYKVTHENEFEKLEILKDQNIHLKNH